MSSNHLPVRGGGYSTVSVSGYYGWRDRKPSCREEENRQLGLVCT